MMESTLTWNGPGRAPFLTLAACLAVSLVCLVLPVPPAVADDNIPRAVQRVEQAVVRIHVVETDYEGGREVKCETFGSGVIISPRGYVVTNHHVAGNGRYFTCTLADTQECDAELVGTDPLTDLAVIRLLPASPREFPSAKFGNSDRLRVGNRVYAIGSPLAFAQSITAGVVSNTKLTMPEIFPDEWLVLDGEDIGTVLQWIGHDAAIYGGNSGGPLINTRGDIVGINELEFGLSGAIPGNLAREVTAQLIARGTVARGWLGFSVQPLLHASPLKHGVLITGALDGSPAHAAGFLPGDILLRLHGQPTDVRSKEELPAFNLQVMALPVGMAAEAVVWRDGKEVTLTVTPAERPAAKYPTREFADWGFCASDLALLRAKELHRGTTAGVLIDSLRNGGAADSARPPLQENDVLVEVGGEAINSLDDLRRVTARVLADRTEPTPVLVVVERKGERCRTVVKLSEPVMRDPGREVRKAWAPIATQVLTADLAEALGHADKTGVCVTRVYPLPGAPPPGLQVGDLIIALDGDPIAASQPEDLDLFPAMVRAYPIGKSVTLTVLRGREEMAVPVMLAAAPPEPREMPGYRDEHFEFTARDLAFLDRVGQGWDAQQQGVLVTAVEDGGWASLGKLESGDLIDTINGISLENVDALKTVMGQLAEEKPACVVVHVKRGIRNQFLEWRARWPRQD